ncbi:flagellar biosynthesis protein FlhA [Desulfonispora thiosulfatigenes DSM 11270]|uniref:Flagellar biosynthesis protein FlhA n=1 Tax=Desulfonispora thiosulfatigenes DSM 11270 TaxID=656914 RepID=A0A1W1UML7_DESTI|nr:flagellar biosynthesis protein FlhA [Desulfonispora thiosulfatigenes]SMB82327.1 flagellar biosynthesis protein FlhA [Desulfonispora thiosulfatigenes DSM 11270]
METSKANISEILRKLTAHNDLLVAALVIAIIMMIIIPLPPGMLDVLLTLNLTIGLIVLLTTLFITQPLQFSVFPSLLLVTTLFRLALNISSTRLILIDANAGSVIDAFGSFVVSGNYVVGMIIFIIITIIQFVVITNGAGRVAEVAARFTLDAMPGKQMSIDADLNAGLISEQDAKERRKTIQREADFFGAMDGASKFVKGDAIAGIIITIINIIGGLIIGMWQLQMPAMEALQTFTILSVGDGLVSQMPALLISTATGILVTRSGSGNSFGIDFTEQLSSFPKVIALAAGIMLILGLIPGLPFPPFMILALGAGYTAYALNKEEKKKEELEIEEKIAPSSSREPENVLNFFKVDPLELEIGYNLIPLTDSDQGGDLLERLAAVRRQCAQELGIYVKPIRIRDNLQLFANSYQFKIRGVEIASGEIMPDQFLAMNPDDSEATIEGIKTTEPTFGLPAWWVTEENKEKIELEGFTVVDAATVLITHLTEFIKVHASELLSKQDTKELIEIVKENNEALVTELVPDQITVGEIQKVLENLLKERISIKDMEAILEAISDAVRLSKDIDYLTESSREKLARNISNQYSSDGKMIVVTLEPVLERELAGSIQNTPKGSYSAISPELTQHIFNQLSEFKEQFALLGLPPVIVTSAGIRLPFRRLIDRYLPELAVLSINELTTELEVEAIGMVKLNED